MFGQIRHARGFRTFGLRGLRKVRGEFSLVATAHDLREPYRRRELRVGGFLPQLRVELGDLLR
ncbi:MAG: transposase [Myxococcales bacterium]|nr:transposase [Myxococcales bacterium]